MFTGIVEEAGRIESAEDRGDVKAVRVSCSFARELRAGDSIAVNGCCLTAVEVDASGFRCDLHQETLSRTAFGDRIVPGARVNLERPMPATGRFDGHIVQGHVDGVGRVLDLAWTGESARLRVAPPPALERYLVEKGSVSVDGVSLTIAGLWPGAFEIALIPFTLERTTLGEARAGQLVNLEADVIAKYVERLLGAAGGASNV